MAALAAAAGGAEVRVLAKTPPGRGSCTWHSGGRFFAALGGMTSSEHASATLEASRGLAHSSLVKILAREAPVRLRHLIDLGIAMVESPGQASVRPAGVSPYVGGAHFLRHLIGVLQERGVRMRSGIVVTRLLLGDSGVRGVECLDAGTGRHFRLEAAAVIIATGGGGRVYGRTDNPVRITGDGYRLLLDAGCRLRDMEFVQYYPFGFAVPGVPPWYVPARVLTETGMVDAAGRDPLPEWLQAWGLTSGKEMERLARDRCAVAMAIELEQDNRFFLMTPRYSREQWSDPFYSALRRVALTRIDIAREPLPVAPTQHYFCGGAITGSSGETDVDGLFACGEVASGADGANRIGGNALSQLLVFGFRAGEAAARHAATRKITGVGESQRQPPKAGGTRSPVEIKVRLNAVCDRHLGVLRHREGLVRCLELLHALDEQTAELSVNSPRGAVLAHELGAMLTVAEMVCQSALMREESRGVHFRTDHPREDPLQGHSFLVIPGSNGTFSVRPAAAEERPAHLPAMDR